MELDTLITYVLLFLFFVLPSILKRKKKKPAKAETQPENLKKKKSFGFGKIGEAIQEFVKELERQALEAKKAAREAELKEAGSPESVWDQLDDRKKRAREERNQGWGDVRDGMPESFTAAAGAEDRDAEFPDLYVDPELKAYDPDHPFAAAEKKSEARPRQTIASPRTRPEYLTPSPRSISPALPAHSLQQAVVWSEILGKPVALRRE